MAAVRQQDLPAEPHGHDHCILCTNRREGARLDQPMVCVAHDRRSAVGADSREWVAIPAPIPLLRVAPKSSPPV
jgi:hypothetical protein